MTQKDELREPALEAAKETTLIGVVDKVLAWNIGYDAGFAAAEQMRREDEVQE